MNDRNVLQYLSTQTTMQNVIAAMPDDCLNYIRELHEVPFPVETETDRELVIFLYMVGLLKDADEVGLTIDDTGHLLALLETTFDHKPEYRVERYYQT